MPFLKKRMEDDEPPQERVERTDRIVREVREEPEYTETRDMEQEPEEPRRKPAPQKPTGFTVRISVEEMRHDIAAHLSVINATAVALERTGMPTHVAQQLTQNLCGANIQRARDIEQVLKQDVRQ
jgi:hypothetical protein